MATDAEIRAAGLYAIPEQRFLQNPFQLPTEEEEVTESFGIPQTQAFNNSGGNDFSVYNPDPNSIVNKNYQPNYDYRQFSEYGSDPSTADIKQMDMNQNYFNKPPVDPKMKGLMSMIPYAGAFTKGVKFLGDQIGPYLPVNRREIMENELGGRGVMVNDIGQIVQGDGAYNTAENIMAGYNANQITQKTIDDRKTTINKSLGKFDKYDKSSPKFDQDKYNQMQDKLNALDKFGKTLDSTNTKVDKMKEFEEEEKKKLRSKTILGKVFGKKKQKKKDAIDLQNKIKAANAAAVNSPDNYGVQGLQRSGSYGGNATYSGSGSTVSRSGDVTNKDGSRGGNINDEFAKDGGRIGYFFGGRVNYKVGGRVNFKDGGLASIL